jgi:flagellar basal body-associated protein FliL
MVEEEDENFEMTGDGVAAPVEKKPLLKRLIPYIAGGAVSVALGIGAGIVSRKPANRNGDTPTTAPAPRLEKFPKKVMVELPELIFNCADTGQMVAGKVNIVLEVQTTEALGKGEKKPHLQDLIDEKGGGYYSRIRDALLNLLSGKVSNDIKTAKGKELLKLEILDQMNRILFSPVDEGDAEMNKEKVEGVVTGVLYTTFLVQ